jgi:CubicO group peptidase (beta-lactamase class C family)
MSRLFILFLLPTFLFGQVDTANLLDKRIEKIISDWQVPGCAIGLVKNGKLIYAKGFGFRDIENKLPVTPKTLFPIASNSKLFTATAIGMLVNENKLDYDKSIKSIVPEIEFSNQNLNENITLRDMLCHRTGITGNDAIWYGSNFSRPELFTRIKYLEPVADLRVGFMYTNYMYIALGEIIKIKTGKTWEEYLTENIFKPLSMTSTVFSIEAIEKTNDFAKPYKTNFIDKNKKAIGYYRQTQASGPANGINSNIIDLSNWVICQLSKGTYNNAKVIPSSLIQETMKPLNISSNSIRDKELSYELYGMGRTMTTYKNHLMTQHGGSINGFRSQITLFPDDSLGVIILTNSADHKITSYLQLEIADVILGLNKTDWHERVFERTKKQFENQIASNSISPKNENIKQSKTLVNYTGTYEHPAYGIIQITLKDKKLHFFFKTFNEPITQISLDKFETSFNDQLGSYTITFNTNTKSIIDNLTLEFEGVVETFVKK